MFEKGVGVAVVTGQRLGSEGRYELLERLGAGNTATVWRAVDRKIHGRSLAVKFFTPGRHASTMVEREVAALGRISHANVVVPLDHGEVAGLHWIAMEYVEGVTLEDWLSGMRERGGQTSLRDALTIFDGICAGVAAAHAAREPVIHRDIKPANVMIREEGRGRFAVKVLDFGIARVAQEAEQGTLAFGTPAYMTPEQALQESHAISPRTDVFSLGVVLLELVTLRWTIVANNGGNQPLYGILLATPGINLRTAFESLRGDAPTGLWEVLVKALAREPNSRFKDADELRDAVAGAALLVGALPVAEKRWSSGTKRIKEVPQSPMLVAEQERESVAFVQKEPRFAEEERIAKTEEMRTSTEALPSFRLPVVNQDVAPKGHPASDGQWGSR